MGNLFSDIKRLVIHPKTYLAVVGVMASIFFSLQDDFANGISQNAVSMYLFAIDSAGFLVAYVFCALPFGTTFCEDLKSRYIRQNVIRNGIRKYVCSRMTVIYISALLVMLFGSALFLLIRGIGYQESFLGNEGYEYLRYGFLISGGHSFWGCMIVALRLGLLAGTLSVMAVGISLYMVNKAAALALPVLIFQILLELGGKYSYISLFFPDIKVFAADWLDSVLTIVISFLTVVVIICIAEQKIKKLL